MIALQEVTRGYSRNDYADLVDIFSAQFPNYFAAFGARLRRAGGSTLSSMASCAKRRFQFGNMVLSRYPIRAVQTCFCRVIETYDKLNLQRGALETVIETPAGALRASIPSISTMSLRTNELHRLGFLKERALAATSPRGALDGCVRIRCCRSAAAGDLQMMGDFNMEPENPEYIAMVAATTPITGARRVPGFRRMRRHTSRPGRRTDSWISEDGARACISITVSSVRGLAGRLEACRVDTSAPWFRPSAVWVELAERVSPGRLAPGALSAMHVSCGREVRLGQTEFDQRRHGIARLENTSWTRTVRKTAGLPAGESDAGLSAKRRRRKSRLAHALERSGRGLPRRLRT